MNALKNKCMNKILVIIFFVEDSFLDVIQTGELLRIVLRVSYLLSELRSKTLIYNTDQIKI